MTSNDQTTNQSKLSPVPVFCKDHPGFTQGGMRHLIFTKKTELEEAGAIVWFGRRLLIDEQVFLSFVRSGGTRVIAGKADK